MESLVTHLVPWGCIALLGGLALDPLQGGTRKAPETLAWFFQSTGLAIFALAVFIIAIELWRRPRSVQLLVDVGQNPMIGYVGYGMVVLPLLGLTGTLRAIAASGAGPWLMFGWGLLLTLVVALMVRTFTRNGIFWRT
jgi:hypothetical protein